MGKRLFLITVFILVLASFVSASITVSLESETVTDNSVTLPCTATVVDGTDSLNKIELFLDTTGIWEVNKTDVTVLGKTTDTITFTVENIPNGDFTWNCKAYNATDATNMSESNGTFSIAFTENTAPTFTGTIADQTFAEDENLDNAFDLDDYFTDTDALTYSSNGASNIEVTISSGSVSFSGAANWSGTETITFTATDTGALTNTSNSILVNVTPVNDAPYYSTIPDLNWTKNTNKTLDLDDYFSDVEGSTLTYNVSSIPENISVSFSGDTVTLSPDDNWLGTRTIVFVANDSELTTESNSVELSVVISGNNTAPTIICLGTGLAKITTNESQKLSVLASDPQEDTVTIAWYVDNTIVDGETSTSYLFSKDTKGIYVVKAEASDGSETASCSWNVNVTDDPESEESNINVEDINVDSIIDEQTQVAECGNGIPEKDENCLTCPEDASCAQNEICSKEGACITEQPSNSTAIIIFFIITFVIAIAGFVIYKMTSKKSERQMFNEALNLENDTGKEKPSVEVHDIYKKEKKPQEPSIPKRPKVLKETPLQKYIRIMKEKGTDSKEIAEKLRKQGWKDEDFKHFL